MRRPIFVIEKVVATDLTQRATNRPREDLLSRVLHLRLGWHESRTPGELIERIDGDVATLGNFLSRFVFEMIGSALLLVGVLVLLYVIDWRIGAALTVFALVALLAMRALLGAAARRWSDSRAADAALYSLLEERLSGTEDVRANRAVPYDMRPFHERARHAFRRRMTAAAFGSASGGT